jgi:hypothetical protein
MAETVVEIQKSKIDESWKWQARLQLAGWLVVLEIGYGLAVRSWWRLRGVRSGHLQFRSRESAAKNSASGNLRTG